jgi:hypothetical protein
MKRFSKIITTAAFAALVPTAAMASSHREAPAISNDPVADNTEHRRYQRTDIAERGEQGKQQQEP